MANDQSVEHVAVDVDDEGYQRIKTTWLAQLRAEWDIVDGQR
jgi:hypothetical protein